MYMPSTIKKESPKHQALRVQRDRTNSLINGLEHIEPTEFDKAKKFEYYLRVMHEMKDDLENMLETVTYEERK